MLHGKHVMVRVGGGWDTLQGFLLKYDPCRILQFATLEQKILAFQKGVSNESVPDSATRTPQPPEMNPLSAVNMFQKQNLKPGTPASASRSKDRQARPPGAVPAAAPTKGSLASLSTRSKPPDSPASFSHPKVTSLKGRAKTPHTAPHSVSSPVASGGNSSAPASSSSAQCVSESVRKGVTFPKTAATMATSVQNSRDLSKSRPLPSKTPGKMKPKPLKHNPLSSREESPVPLSSKCPKLPKGNMRGGPNSSPSQSPARVTTPHSKARAGGLGTQSQPPDRPLKSRAISAPRLHHPASSCSVPSTKATREPKGENIVSVTRKQPQSKGTCQKTGPSSPGRTPLSIVSVPQSAAKTETGSKSAQTATQGQYSAKGPPKSGMPPPSTRKPPSSGKGAASGDKKPTAKKKEGDDHYFVMTGSKKLRK